jgi:outer membrane biosynthesis protein TonB
MPSSSFSRLRTALTACAFAATTTAFASADPPSVPTPEPIPTEAPGVICRYPDFVTLQDAFATPVTDIITLRFIAHVENLSPKDQAATLKRIAVPQLPAAHTEIEAAEQIGCTQPQIGLRTARLLYAISARWTTANASDALVSAARWAIGALQIRDRIGVPILDSTLAGFGTSYATLSAPVANATPSCPPDRDAQITAAVQPPYPSFAGASSVGGTVLVKVSLDREGLVTAASVLTREVPANQAGDELARVSLGAAATSTYAPEIAKCTPIDGTYIFRADFHVKH